VTFAAGEVGRSAAHAPATMDYCGLVPMWVGQLQQRQYGGAAYGVCIPNRATLCHLGRLAHGTWTADGGDKQSTGHSEVGVPERRHLVFGWGARDYNHRSSERRLMPSRDTCTIKCWTHRGSKSRHGGHSAGTRSGTGSHVDHPAQNIARDVYGAFSPQTTRRRPITFKRVPILRASSMPPLGPTISATPATRGRLRRCVLPACP